MGNEGERDRERGGGIKRGRGKREVTALTHRNEEVNKERERPQKHYMYKTANRRGSHGQTGIEDEDRN